MRDSLIKLEDGSVSEEVFEERKNKCKVLCYCVCGTTVILSMSVASFLVGVYYTDFYSDGSELN
jgi:hypothetical protein|tara:strand:+ start:1215 stop:1406 length:192 start_codon:yes stop_codon:yes gene_type:complete